MKIQELKESFENVKTLSPAEAIRLEKIVMSASTKTLKILAYGVGKIPFVNSFAHTELVMRGEA